MALYSHFAGKFRFAVNRERMGQIPWCVGLFLFAIENIVGADIKHRNVKIVTDDRYVLGAVGIDKVGKPRLGLSLINIGVGGAMYDKVEVFNAGENFFDPREIS